MALITLVGAPITEQPTFEIGYFRVFNTLKDNSDKFLSLFPDMTLEEIKLVIKYALNIDEQHYLDPVDFQMHHMQLLRHKNLVWHAELIRQLPHLVALFKELLIRS